MVSTLDYISFKQVLNSKQKQKQKTKNQNNKKKKKTHQKKKKKNRNYLTLLEDQENHSRSGSGGRDSSLCKSGIQQNQKRLHTFREKLKKYTRRF